MVSQIVMENEVVSAQLENILIKFMWPGETMSSTLRKMSHFCPFFWPFFIFEYFNNGQIERLSNMYVHSCSHRHSLDGVPRDGNRSNGVPTEMILIESCHCARSENTKLNNKVLPAKYTPRRTKSNLYDMNG